MGKGLLVEKKINEIEGNCYERVIKAAKEAIQEFEDEKLVGKKRLADFINTLLIKLKGTNLNENAITNIGHILMEESNLGSGSGFYYLRLRELVYDVENIKFVKNDLGNIIGIQIDE